MGRRPQRADMDGFTGQRYSFTFDLPGSGFEPRKLANTLLSAVMRFMPLDLRVVKDLMNHARHKSGLGVISESALSNVIHSPQRMSPDLAMFYLRAIGVRSITLNFDVDDHAAILRGWKSPVVDNARSLADLKQVSEDLARIREGQTVMVKFESKKKKRKK